ncbi:hypothetical protein [Kitasatospora griseola]|uniref:hypothetical protein n=1 Tax=Kitasatospora griseola TaxID=2064 RepID=UPI0037FDA9D8
MIELPEGSWWDWDVVSWDPSRLILGALVYRYWRGELGPGERLASWVRRPE